MKRFLIVLLLLPLFAQPVRAIDLTVPSVPESAEQYMPESTDSFWQDLLFVIESALNTLQPQVTEAAALCISVLAVVLLASILRCISAEINGVINLVTTIVIATLLILPANTLIDLGVETIQELSEYGKLLLPVMTAALAAQGGTTTSAALYAGTALFSAILSALITKLLIPMLYIYLCLCIANSAIGEDVLRQLRDFLKWLISWSMKIILYVFLGYMSITGVISGTADASAVKAAKIAISGAVPVVGNILSDASETILVSAGIMKNSAGTYGLLALTAILVGPFARIGIQYIMLKLTSAVSTVFAFKESTQLIGDFSSGMGYVLAMTGTSCLLLMISVVCFMKGVA